MPENNGEASGSVYVIGRSNHDEPDVRPGNGAPAVVRVTGRDWPTFTYVIANAYQKVCAEYFGIPW